VYLVLDATNEANLTGEHGKRSGTVRQAGFGVIDVCQDGVYIVLPLVTIVASMDQAVGGRSRRWMVATAEGPRSTTS
jgi:hypothetical protein